MSNAIGGNQLQFCGRSDGGKVSFARVKAHYGDPLWDIFGYSFIVHII
jgi:hypothetical protein